MKIAVVSETFHIGGVGLITIRYAIALAQLGHSVSLIVINPDNPYQITIPKLHNLIVMPLYSPYTLKEFVELLDSHDIVILSNTAIMPFGLEATRFIKNAFSVEILHTATMAAVTPTVDLTVAVSKHIYDNMKPREGDIILPNAVDTSLFYPIKDRVPSRTVRLIQIAKEGKIMSPDLYEIAKDLLADGFDIEAVIVGRQGSNEERIRFLGVQPYEEIAKLLQHSDIMLHMSAEESFGMTIIEAMACGVIPVASKVGGILEIIEDNKNGFIIENSNKTMLIQTLKKLCSYIQDKEPYINEIRHNAIQVVRNRYDIKTVMGKLLTIIEARLKNNQRLEKESKYPFSLTAPFLFLSMQSYDRYFTAIRDIINDDDITNEYANWQRFYNIMYQNIIDKASLSVLDSIYKNMVNDLQQFGKTLHTINFWCAMLSLTCKQYQKTLSYLQTNANLNLATVIKIIFSLIILWFQVTNKDKFKRMTDLALYIKWLWINGKISEIENLHLDIKDIIEIIKRTEFKPIIELIQEK